ncbi:Ca-activated chloride channel family protein [Chitinophaga skermanii]|uniref:Ca-activated chloride channel family protein n=1 Tax=Chitinophaga skermanii TaxID=331697 RepID=A0A327Q7X2_9BACT|nr:VWA domain-containing protein [Chitinophaga skermanii]RAI99907.1 Ca-activated chloride channel family protein [Chitinophaga skermanii]
MQRLLLWLSLICSSLFVKAQQNWISGAIQDAITHQPIADVRISSVGDSTKTTTNQYGLFRLAVSTSTRQLKIEHPGYHSTVVNLGTYNRLSIALEPLPQTAASNDDAISKAKAKARLARGINPNYGNVGMGTPVFFNETYGKIFENKFIQTNTVPTSSFSVDVDRAAYSNVRRFIKLKENVPPDAVRIEEMVNYFSYNFIPPRNDAIFAVYGNYTTCPWRPENKLFQIAIRGKQIPTDSLPASNLVLLIDVSGSMGSPNKLPLLQAAARVLINNLRPKDKLAIVTYAGTPTIVLKSTTGDQKEKLFNAVDYLSARGATAGESAINCAYQVAEDNYIPGGNNRVILATDGDFNVGQTSDRDMEDLIHWKKETGVYLTCLGFGMHDYKDSKLEGLASKGNGNFAYIDNLEEANKVFAREFGSTLFTVAKDVRAEVRFNPQYIKSYRLIGYENKVVKEDLREGEKQSGGIVGAGHSVVAMYEIEPQPGTPPGLLNNIAAIDMQYRTPESNVLQQMHHDFNLPLISFDESPDDFQFAAGVALWGMLLRNSSHRGTGNYDMVVEIAKKALGKDTEGYRNEFIKLVKVCKKQIPITQK